MDNQQKPSVGRIVHYISYGTPNGEFKPEHRAAIITRVGDDDGTVDLCIMNPTGLFFNQGVKFGTREGQWHWVEMV